MEKKTALEVLRFFTGLTVTDTDAYRIQTQVSYVEKAMESYAQQEREIAVKKALEEVINQKNAYQKSGFIVETRDEDILSLYPKVIETLIKD